MSVLTRSLQEKKRTFDFFDVTESECLLDRLTQSDYADMPGLRKMNQEKLFGAPM